MDSYIDETVVATAAIEGALTEELTADDSQSANVMIVNANDDEVDPNDDSIDYEDEEEDTKEGVIDDGQTQETNVMEGQQDLDDIIIAEAVQVWIHLEALKDQSVLQLIWSIGHSIQL